MINDVPTMPCPTCGTKIQFDLNLLLAGTKITCSNCYVEIGLTSENATTARETMENLKKLKTNSRD